LKRLVNYELDIALFINFSSYNPPARMETIKEQELNHQILATLPASVCVGKNHPLYNKAQINMEELQHSKLLVTSKSSLSSILPAYLPVKKSNTLVAQGYNVRQMILNAGQAFQVQHLPAPDFQQEGLRYIPIEGLNYVVYMVTNPKSPLCTEAKRFVELLKEEINIAYH
jgi:DNA-binding transcriptional LysR family regulator